MRAAAQSVRLSFAAMAHEGGQKPISPRSRHMKLDQPPHPFRSRIGRSDLSRRHLDAARVQIPRSHYVVVPPRFLELTPAMISAIRLCASEKQCGDVLYLEHEVGGHWYILRGGKVSFYVSLAPLETHSEVVLMRSLSDDGHFGLTPVLLNVLNR